MTNYLVFGVRTDNGNAGTYTSTLVLPQGTNILVGVQFYGGNNTWVRVYDNGTASNSNLRFSFYTLNSAQDFAPCMAFVGKTCLLELVTAAKGYYGFNVTIANEPANVKWQENLELPGNGVS